MLDECYNICPNVEYDGISSEMESTINELIVYAYNEDTDNGFRAQYISDRMSQIYSNVKWSCFLFDSQAAYGYNIWNVNDLFYAYTYKGIDWIVFSGFH